MDPRTALAAYQASCLTNAKQIEQFLTRWKGFGLTYGEAEELDDMVRVLMDQVDGMEDKWDATQSIHEKKNFWESGHG